MIRSAIPFAERTRHRWRSILPLFGVDARYLTGKQVACPICQEGRTRFHFSDREGAGTWYCNREDRGGDGVKLVMAMNGWDFAEAAKHIEAHLGDAPVQTAKPKKRDEEATRQRMNEAWRAAGPVREDTAAGRYLGWRIGPGPFASDLRASRRLYCKEDDGRPASYRPAMLALVRDGDGTPTALHRTYLTEEGRQAPIDSVKRVMGSMPPGVAVRLAPIAAQLGIAEGIETALACTALTGIACWSALNAGQLERWSPPSGVEHVVIFADRDESRVGERAGHRLADRVLGLNLNVEMRLPPTVGDDWADVWLAQRQHGEAA